MVHCVVLTMSFIIHVSPLNILDETNGSDGGTTTCGSLKAALPRPEQYAVVAIAFKWNCVR